MQDSHFSGITVTNYYNTDVPGTAIILPNSPQHNISIPPNTACDASKSPSAYAHTQSLLYMAQTICLTMVVYNYIGKHSAGQIDLILKWINDWFLPPPPPFSWVPHCINLSRQRLAIMGMLVSCHSWCIVSVCASVPCEECK